MKSYSAIVQLPLKCYVGNDNIAKLDAEVCSFRRGLTAPADYAREVWTKAFSCGSVYDEKLLRALFLEEGTHPIREALQH